MILPKISLSAPLVDDKGRPVSPWVQFFAALIGQPRAISVVSVTSSPLTLTASESGFYSIFGGTVTALKFQRSKTIISLNSTSGVVPVAQGDIIVVTYSVAPTINFIPG